MWQSNTAAAYHDLKDGTQVVRMKKKSSGEIVTDCDVYIGPTIANANWNLQQSFWCNQNSRDKHRLYKLNVLADPERMSKLESLRGKTLGCWHEPPAECHGTVLIDLLKSHFPCASEHPQLVPQMKFHFFKGFENPLSNIYSHHFKVDGDLFHSVQQYVAYRRAKFEGNEQLANDFLHSESSMDSLILAIETWEGQKNPMGVQRSIYFAEKGTRAKYMGCEAFRKACREHPLCIFVESTPNNFWGMGPENEKLHGKNPTDFTQINGLSTWGWLVRKVDLYMSNGGDYSELSKLNNRLPRCAMKVGLSMVMGTGNTRRKKQQLKYY